MARIKGAFGSTGRANSLRRDALSSHFASSLPFRSMPLAMLVASLGSSVGDPYKMIEVNEGTL